MKTRSIMVLATVLIFVSALVAEAATPTIGFTYIPSIGSFDNLTGSVSGVDPANYVVAVYIRVHGGWWTKPYWAWPTTEIGTDKKWSCDITTGGVDEEADAISAYLIPKGYDPPLAYGESYLPSKVRKHAVAKAYTERQ